MLNKEKERQWFFLQEKIPLTLDVTDNGIHKFYKLKNTGQVICELELNEGLGDKRLEIAQISDIHFNYCSSEDDNDPELMLTKKCREWLANGVSVVSAIRAMDVAQYFDQTIITGDILDYQSNGAKYLTQKYIFERDPNVICTVGGHDLTKQMQTGQQDKTSLQERLSELEKIWIHDIYYYSRVLKDKVMVIGLNNGLSRYFQVQIDLLKKDIKKAKKENLIIYIFQHEPLSTGNEEDKELHAVWAFDKKVYNFFDGKSICKAQFSDDISKELYRIICQNADIIRGVFCGHLHSFFYSEINGSYIDEYGEHTKKIPQYVMPANPYLKHVGIITRIIVK